MSGVRKLHVKCLSQELNVELNPPDSEANCLPLDHDATGKVVKPYIPQLYYTYSFIFTVSLLTSSIPNFCETYQFNRVVLLTWTCCIDSNCQKTVLKINSEKTCINKYHLSFKFFINQRTVEEALILF